MASVKPGVLVTGVAGNLGTRLLAQLADFEVTGVDFAPSPAPPNLARYQRLDLGMEPSCAALVRLLQETQATAVVHLAFVIDPLRTGVLDVERMWQINVAGTARVMEAIAEVNRMGGNVNKFIFPSSVATYGSDLPVPVTEEAQLAGHTLPYAIHKREADEVAQERAQQLGECHSFILRPHIYAGASMQNYLVGALRGTPTGHGKLAERLRRRGTRLPLVLPFGAAYMENKFQFVHVDDMARLIVWLLRRDPESVGLTVLNVSGRGAALSLRECLELGKTKCMLLPGRMVCRWLLQLLWAMGVSGVPPEALPYMIGSYTMNTARLEKLLGKDYGQVMEHTVRDALADCFHARA